MSETTLLVCGGIGIALTVGAVAAPQFVLPAMAVAGLAESIGPVWEAMQGIGNTAEGNSFAYEKAKEYGRNYAKLIVYICDIADFIDILKDPALLRSLVAKLLDSSAASLLNDLSFLRRAAIGSLDDALKLLKEKVSPEALKALAAAMKEYGKKQLRRVVEAVEKVYDNTKEVLTKECVPKLLKEIRECEGSLNDAVERVVRWIKKGIGSRAYKEGFQEHLIHGTLGKKGRGVVGGHNFDSFKKVLSDAGFDIDDCIINEKKHPEIEGIYEVEYRIPARKYGSTGELEIIPNQYKKIVNPKTVYDPAVISDEQMIQWGKEAMESGTIVGREITGYASNGLKFVGYIDLPTGEIKNFYPVLE